MLVYGSQKVKMIYLPKQVCLIIIHRNTRNILNMSCCHKYQQQNKIIKTLKIWQINKINNKYTKIHLFIHYMYADILFPLTKVISIMFKRVITHYQTLWTWLEHNAKCYHNVNVLPYALPHRLPYILSH